MASWEETGAWLLFAVPQPASCVLAVTEAVYLVVTGSAAWEEESMDYNGKFLYPKPLTTVAVFSFLFYRFSFLFFYTRSYCVALTGLELTL